MINNIQEKLKILEREFISRLLNEPEEVKTASFLIKPDELYYYRNYYEVILDSHFNDKNLDRELSTRKLKIAELLAEYPIRKTPSIAKELKEIGNSHRVFAILENYLHKVPFQGVFEYISKLQKDLLSNLKRFDEDKDSIQQIIAEFREKQDFYRTKPKDQIIGLSTGFNKLDNIIDGLRPEHLWVIGGYTNMGKTSAVLNIVSSLIEQEKKAVYYSLEMGKIDILQRLLGIMTSQNGLSILKGYAEDEAVVDKVLDQITKSDLSIHSFNSNINDLIASMFEETLKKPVDLFVVDFIQLVTVEGARSEYETLTTAILELQKAAKRFKVPIIVLSQISNDGARNNDSPVMSFKGSGSIASAADLAIEIKSGEESTETLKRKLNNNESIFMKWDVKKNRHGKVGTIEMIFNGQTGRFILANENQINQHTFGDFADKQ